MIIIHALYDLSQFYLVLKFNQIQDSLPLSVRNTNRPPCFVSRYASGFLQLSISESGHTYFLYYKTSTYRPQVQFIRIDPELNDELVFEFKSSGGETDRGAVIFYFTIPGN